MPPTLCEACRHTQQHDIENPGERHTNPADNPYLCAYCRVLAAYRLSIQAEIHQRQARLLTRSMEAAKQARETRVFGAGP